MTAIIRLAQQSDIPAMHTVRTSVRENRLSRPDILSEASYQPFIENKACWVALVEAQIAGFAALDVQDASVWALFVSPAIEGSGTGKALHQTLVLAAASAGLHRLCLVTEPGSRAASFYERAGWRHTGQAETSNEEIYELTLPGT